MDLAVVHAQDVVLAELWQSVVAVSGPDPVKRHRAVGRLSKPSVDGRIEKDLLDVLYPFASCRVRDIVSNDVGEHGSPLAA
jgi:hypothetical protein